MSIYYYSDLKHNRLKNYPLENQQSVVFNNKVYKILTYQVLSDWSYTKKALFKMFWAFLGAEQYQKEGHTWKYYVSKAFSRHRTKQIVIPKNDLEQIEYAVLPQVDKESRLGRLLYWKDVLISTSGDKETKAYFLSKHFSKIPSSSNFSKICLMPVYENRSTVVFLPSGSFAHVTEEIAQLPEDEVLVLFYTRRFNSTTLRLLGTEDFLKRASSCPVTNTEGKKFRVFGLEQDIALPFPQKLVDILRHSEPTSSSDLT